MKTKKNKSKVKKKLAAAKKKVKAGKTLTSKKLTKKSKSKPKLSKPVISAVKKKTSAKKAKAKVGKAKIKVGKAKAKPKKAAKKVFQKPQTATAKTKMTTPKTTTRPSKSTVKKKAAVKKTGRLKVVRSKDDPVLIKIKQKLIYERNDLLRMIASSQEIERNVGELAFSNEIDLASSLEGREMASHLSSRERNELRLMDEALYRISAGTYGNCESCSKRIGIKRLQIMPLTSLCIECQETSEH